MYFRAFNFHTSPVVRKYFNNKIFAIYGIILHSFQCFGYHALICSHLFCCHLCHSLRLCMNSANSSLHTAAVVMHPQAEQCGPNVPTCTIGTGSAGSGRAIPCAPTLLTLLLPQLMKCRSFITANVVSLIY